MQQLRFDGQVALVTGGATGIGHAICAYLAARGASVVINGNYRPSGEGPEVQRAEELRAEGADAVSVNGSVCDDAAVERMVAKALDTYGRLDILVNNAGRPETRCLVDCAPNDAFDQQIDVHLRGALRMTRAAWPHLIKSGHGRVLNLGSALALSGLGPDGYDMAYPTAKAGLFAITRQQAGAGAPHGINVNLLMPWAESAMTIGALSGTPLGAWISEKAGAEKVAASILYLLHPSCAVTGQFISSAGGRIARIFFGQSEGYFNPNIAPEDVRDNWDAIAGVADGDRIPGSIEIRDMQHEFAILQKHLGPV